jgi:WD40 repeat protein
MIWDTDRHELLAELPPVTPTDGDFVLAFPAVSSSGDRAAIPRNNSVLVYELPGGRLLRTITHPAAVNAVAFANDRRDLISGAVDGSLQVTTDSGVQLSIPTATTAAGIDAVALLANGRVLAADAKQQLRIYDPRGNVFASLTTQARVRAFRVSPDGHELTTIPSVTGRRAPLEVWDLERGQQLSVLHQDDDAARVLSARFISNHELLTAHSDGAIRRWHASTGQLLQTYRGSTWFLADATLSPDGSMVIAGGRDGVLRFWDAQSGLPLWTLPAHPSPIVGVRADGGDIVTRSLAGALSRWHVPTPSNVFATCSHHALCEIAP